jgi:hypothetical protein
MRTWFEALFNAVLKVVSSVNLGKKRPGDAFEAIFLYSSRTAPG